MSYGDGSKPIITICSRNIDSLSSYFRVPSGHQGFDSFNPIIKFTWKTAWNPIKPVNYDNSHLYLVICTWYQTGWCTMQMIEWWYSNGNSPRNPYIYTYVIYTHTLYIYVIHIPYIYILIYIMYKYIPLYSRCSCHIFVPIFPTSSTAPRPCDLGLLLTLHRQAWIIPVDR